jgi:hypothetical protein
VGSEASAEWEPAAERFPEAHEIWKDPLAFMLEDHTGATKPREDLIEDEERTIRTRQLGEPGEEARRRNPHTSSSLDGLDDDGAHGLVRLTVSHGNTLRQQSSDLCERHLRLLLRLGKRCE